MIKSYSEVILGLNFLFCSSKQSVFIPLNNILYTPNKKLDLIAGITRNYILSNSKIKTLEVKSKINEIARLLSNEEITSDSIKQATNMMKH